MGCTGASDPLRGGGHKGLSRGLPVSMNCPGSGDALLSVNGRLWQCSISNINNQRLIKTKKRKIHSEKMGCSVPLPFITLMGDCGQYQCTEGNPCQRRGHVHAHVGNAHTCTTTGTPTCTPTLMHACARTHPACTFTHVTHACTYSCTRALFVWPTSDLDAPPSPSPQRPRPPGPPSSR